MNLCDANHGEVCYESRYCPACEKNEEIEALVQQLEELKAELAAARDQ